MTGFNFESLFAGLGRPAGDTHAERLQRPARRTLSGVCDLTFHILCGGRNRHAAPCMCDCHRSKP
jgi:hypothetical protein